MHFFTPYSDKKDEYNDDRWVDDDDNDDVDAKKMSQYIFNKLNNR